MFKLFIPMLALLLNACATTQINEVQDDCFEKMAATREKLKVSEERIKYVKTGDQCSIVFKTEKEMREERMTTADRVVRFIGTAISNNYHQFSYSTVRMPSGTYSVHRSGSITTIRKIK